MIILQDIKRIKNPIYFDRMIVKGNLKQFVFVVLLLPIVIFDVGLFLKWILLLVFDSSEPFAIAHEGLFWDTYENYVNPNSCKYFSNK